MDNTLFQPDVWEQLAEALPLLGQATLKQALVGLHKLLARCPNPTHQKLMIWLWTLGYERFGPVSLESDGTGFRLWFPDDGADFVVAAGDVEVSVRVDPVKGRRGELTATSKQIEAQPRSAAHGILDHLAKRVAKQQRKADKQEEPGKTQAAKKQPEFTVRPAANPSAPVVQNDPLVTAIGDLLINDWQQDWEARGKPLRADVDGAAESGVPPTPGTT